jgi:3-methyl-2-oxobutanoate hydroxymethyltransferase
MEKLRINDILENKKNRKKISVVTAYDYPSALIADKAGIDIILVGDTCSMVVLGYETTIPITMDEMIHHCKAVKRGVKRALIIGDMPFMSFNISKEQAITNAGRFIKEGGCDAVKIEGGYHVKDTINAVIESGIQVMGHVGLTPQTATSVSGYRLQGKSAITAINILQDSKNLGKIGVFSLVLESITSQVAKMITDKIMIPTIGIGSGPYCDGQVLVLHDLLGLFDKFVPKFVKKYANLGEEILKALKTYDEEVKTGKFPTNNHSFQMNDLEFKKFQKYLRKK